MELKLKITLQKPPAGIDYGLQKGSGNNYEVIGVQRSGVTDLFFELTVEIKGDRRKNAEPDFKGPFVQGPVGGRFIYLDIGKYAGQAGELGGRLKIPLTGIAWDIIKQTNGNSIPVLITMVPGTGKNGGPAYATVKPFEGWQSADGSA